VADSRPAPESVPEPVAAVRRHVAAHREEMLDELREYVARPSVSATGEGFPEITDYVVELVRRCGLDAQALETAGRPAVVGHAQGPPEAPHVLIYGHYDVQPAGPLEHWHSPPFVPQVRDGRIFGRGTGDNKGQHLAHLLAVRTLHEVDGGLPCSVTILLDGEEELGSPYLPDLVAAHRERFAADLVVWSDGPVHASGRACVMLGMRGIVRFELWARGARYALHSGAWGGVAPNPADALVRALASLRAPDGTIAVDGFYDDVRPFSDGERRAMAELPVDVPATMAGLGLRDPGLDGRQFHERLALPALNVNSLSCEDGGDHRTVIPSVAVARCDLRLTYAQRAEQVVQALRDHLARHAPGVQLRVTGGAMQPSRTLPESPYLAAVRRGAAAGLDEVPLVVPAMRGSLPLHVFTELLGLPCFGVPLANVDEANHAPNENLELTWFYRGVAASAGILAEVAAQAAAAAGRCEPTGTDRRSGNESR